MIVALLLACAGRVAVGDNLVADVPAPADYDASVRAATRELKLYEALSTALLMRVAYLDPAFRRAREDMRAHLFLLSPEERAERLAASLAEAETAHVFLLSADSQWRDDLRFGFGDEAPWRLRLFAGGKVCTPERVTPIEPTPLDARLDPFHTSWSTLHEVRFQTDCGRSSPMILQVTGPRGAGELSWRLDPSG